MDKYALDRSLKYIKSWLQFRYEQDEIPGFSVAIAHKGQVVLEESYGYANLELKTKLNPQHIFRIASHSKTFTATAIMQLQENSTLRIDDYVSDYLPWLKEHADKRWQKVTIRQLMAHGAGVIRDGNNSDYWQLDCPFPNEKVLKEVVLSADLIIDTNTKLKYSNIGYSLLGMVIASASNMAYNEYVTKNIIDVLKLPNTGPEYSPKIAHSVVTGYTRRDTNKTRLPIEDISTNAMASATGFYSTAADLCTYFNAHFVGSKLLLDDESKKEMQRVQWHAKTPGQSNSEDYGLGLEIEYLNDRILIGHGGGFPGQITSSLADAKDELVVVVMTNCLGGPAGTITKGIYSIFDFFKDNSSKDDTKHLSAIHEGRFMSLWSITDIVATTKGAVAIYPDSWFPFSDPETLEFVSKNIFKVTDTSSFSSEGELVHFHVTDGKVTTLNYNGSTMWLADEWIKRQEKRKIVALS